MSTAESPGEAAFTDGTVAAVMTRNVATVKSGANLADAVEALVANSTNRAIYVVDEHGHVVGAVSFRTVVRAVNARLGARASGPVNMVRYFRDLTAATVDDLMRTPVSVQEATPLAAALEMMEETRENDLPVVDADNVLVGELRGFDVLSLASSLVRRGEDAVAARRVEL